jgi:hypothetical protein
MQTTPSLRTLPSVVPFRAPIRGQMITNGSNGTYFIGEYLGGGSYGDVYECTDEWANRLVAKVLKPSFSFDEIRRQWESEVSNLVRMRHPNITHIHDAFFFDNAFYFDFLREARAAGIDVPIIPGIIPITDVKQLTTITNLCGAAIPTGLRTELDRRASDPDAVLQFGVAYATEQCADLLRRGAPGIHFYTLNRSPATRAILSALRLMAPWRGAVPV